MTKNVKNVSRFANIQLQNGFPMRASDSSVGGNADQFHTTHWAAVMVSAGGRNQSVTLRVLRRASRRRTEAVKAESRGAMLRMLTAKNLIIRLFDF